MASLFGARTVEEPTFTVIKKAAEYEIRQYGPQIRAIVTMEGGMDKMTGASFRALAGYIFGGNESRQKVAMTAPVGVSTGTEATAPSTSGGEAQKIAMTAPVGISEAGDSSKKTTTMTFTMPSKFKSISDLPVPKDPRVRLVEVPAHKLAVIQFSWNFNESRMLKMEQKLREAAARDGVKLSEKREDVVLHGYNPPWTLPWLKHNEVCIPVLD